MKLRFGPTRLSMRPSGPASLAYSASVHLAAGYVGEATRALELTLDYLRPRHQFGKPIGTFQALKHRSADAPVVASLARELVHGAAASLAQVDPADVVLAGRTAEVAHSVTGEAIQLHAGIGFTDEHDVGLYYRRALADRDLRDALVDRRAELAASLGRG